MWLCECAGHEWEQKGYRSVDVFLAIANAMGGKVSSALTMPAACVARRQAVTHGHWLLQPVLNCKNWFPFSMVTGVVWQKD